MERFIGPTETRFRQEAFEQPEVLATSGAVRGTARGNSGTAGPPGLLRCVDATTVRMSDYDHDLVIDLEATCDDQGAVLKRAIRCLRASFRSSTRSSTT